MRLLKQWETHGKSVTRWVFMSPRLMKAIHRNKTIGDLVMLVNGMPENKQSLIYKMALTLDHISDEELR